MELANCLVALAGNRDTTVPKYGVTTAEIAVLLTIHGPDSVFDIEPLDEEKSVPAREEVARLLAQYPARDEDGKLVVLNVYPGTSPIVHQTLSDLGLPDALYKTTERVKPKASKKAKPAAEPKPEPIVVADPASADSLFAD